MALQSSLSKDSKHHKRCWIGWSLRRTRSRDLSKSFTVPQEREECMFPPTAAATLHSQLTYSKRPSDHRKVHQPYFWPLWRQRTTIKFGLDLGLPHSGCCLLSQLSIIILLFWLCLTLQQHGFSHTAVSMVLPYKQNARPNTESGLVTFVALHCSRLENVAASLLVLRHWSSHWIKWGNTVHSPSLTYQLCQSRQWMSGWRGINSGHLTFCICSPRMLREVTVPRKGSGRSASGGHSLELKCINQAVLLKWLTVK